MNLNIKEEWKDYYCKGLNYKVSNLGRVIGVSSGKVLKQRLNEDGYKVITLGKRELGRTSKTVHRLVALLFIDNSKNLPEVNHKDFDRANNVFTNLEWTTHKENVDYTIKANRHISCDEDKLKGENNPNYNNHTLKEKYKTIPNCQKKIIQDLKRRMAELFL